jgi:hypothetical protein
MALYLADLLAQIVTRRIQKAFQAIWQERTFLDGKNIAEGLFLLNVVVYESRFRMFINRLYASKRSKIFAALVN